MLDRIVSGIARKSEIAPDPSYTPEHVITNQKLIAVGGDELTVLLPGWHGGGIAYHMLRRRLLKSGQDVLSYSCHAQLLEPHIDRVVESFRALGSNIASHLDSLRPKYRKINLIATSLGNVSLGAVTRKFQDFESATLVVGGSSLAKGVWEGVRTTKLRESFEKQGIPFEYLEARWASIAPANNADALFGKNIHMHVATNDIVIPTSQQIELVESVKAVNPETTVTNSSSGHYWASIDFCLKGLLQHC